MQVAERRMRITSAAAVPLPVVPALVLRLFVPVRSPGWLWPLLALALALLVFSAWTRLRHGLPRPWPAALLILAQLGVAALILGLAGADLVACALAATVLLVLLPEPWSLLGFLAVHGLALLEWSAQLAQTPWAITWLVPSLTAGLAVAATLRATERALALGRTRVRLAGLAVASERRRVSRDLHDTLGQEITAIGLRAELAAQLTTTDPAAAAENLRDIQRITERTMGTVRQVARGDWRPEFGAEFVRGTEMLAGAGIHWVGRFTAVVPENLNEVLARVFREAVTNVLKHSSARTFTLTTEQDEEVFRMVIDNDGFRLSRAAPGSGLAGLRHRVEEIGGVLRAGRTGRSGYRLAVELPR